ncbi:MAG: discoidin domain-containing protein, partial [Tepidisphaeraceae bacterium]
MQKLIDVRPFFVALLCFVTVVGAVPALGAAPAAPHDGWKNLALGKPVAFAAKPDYPDTTDADDAAQLTDGKLVEKSPIWYDRACVGWVGPKAAEFTIDLGAVSPVRGVAVRTAAGISGVGRTGDAHVAFSDDGQTFSTPESLTCSAAPAGGYEVVWLETAALKTHGRYVRFSIKPADTGHGCFFFCDEVQIYRGEEAYLKTPLTTTPAGREHSPRPNLANLASKKTVTLVTPPNYPETSDSEDAKQLTDGELAETSPIWGDKRTVGWVGIDPVSFTVDLGSDQPIRGAALHTAGGQAGVEWPAAIVVQVSVDAKQYAPAGDLVRSNDKPPGTGYASRWFATDQLQTHGRYVKFIVTPTTRGNGTYVFSDEVEIYRGDDAWLAKPLKMSEAPDEWHADWSMLSWRERPVAAAEMPVRIDYIDSARRGMADAPLQRVLVGTGGLTFALTGEAGKPRRMMWAADLPQPISTAKCNWAVLQFHGVGFRRTYDTQPVFTLKGYSDASGDGNVDLLETNLVPNDDRTHTLVTKLPAGFTLQQLQASVLTESDAASLTIDRLQLMSSPPAVFNTQISDSAMSAGYEAADLSRSVNGSAARWFEEIVGDHKIALDGATQLKAGDLSVSGIPFTIASGEKNIALLPDSKPTEAQVQFLGQQVAKKFLEPESRDDALTVDVGVHAREAFLLLGVSVPPVKKRGGLTSMPLQLTDAECISVELTYDAGDTEIAFPYSIADGACVVPARTWGAYAVAVDPARELKRVTVRTRQFGLRFALAGLTFNTGHTPIVPELADVEAPPVVHSNADPADRTPTVSTEGTRLTIKNRWAEYTFDLRDGFILSKYVNRWNEAAPISLGTDSGLSIRVGERVYSGRSFNAAIVHQSKTTAELRLTSRHSELPLQIDLSITADDSPALAFDTRVTNTGKAPLAAEICLPAVSDMNIGALGETRVFFPQYRAVDTGRAIALRAPYGPEFASQFMAIYSREQGIGLSVRTDNPSQRMADFTLRKDKAGVSAGVAFPAAYNTLNAGETRAMPRVSLVSHNGDWHAALTSYRDWVRTWYHPVKAQDKSYFQRAWEIACYRTSDVISWNDTRVPPLITKDRTRWMTDDVMAFEKKARGHLPDIVHLFNWTYNDATKQNEYGAFGTELAYRQVGGLGLFKQGIRHMQDDLNIPVSLYTIIDRLRVSAVPKAIGDAVMKETWHQELDNDASAKVRASGSVDGIVYPKIGYELWINYIAADIAKMQRDTGCKLVYVDVMPYFSHLSGFNGKSPRDADMDVVKKLRDILPADVALWTEYPFTDVASQYADGSLNYYFLDLSQVFAREYDAPDQPSGRFNRLPLSANRFALTGYKSIGLPAYIEASDTPSQVDTLF